MKLSNKGRMKLFVTGEQEPEFIYETLDELSDNFKVSSIVGSACSPCMKYVSDWCEETNIPLTLYLPESFDELSVIECNISAIDKERPKFLLLYGDSEAMSERICSFANKQPYVEFIAKGVDI